MSIAVICMRLNRPNSEFQRLISSQQEQSSLRRPPFLDTPTIQDTDTELQT